MGIAKGETLPGNKKIIVVGGGASGVLLACHVLRQARANVHVIIIEKRDELGRGTAFSTQEPRHVLNVRAINMSAFADDPDHFCRWLESSDSDGSKTDYAMRFVPRQTYGRYLHDTLASSVAASRCGSRLTIVKGEAVAAGDVESGIRIFLDDGQTIDGDVAVLAIGHEQWAPETFPEVVDPWRPPAEAGVSRAATILVEGSGLTMIDYVLSLRANGHMGQIYAMSRRGLIPATHELTIPIRFAEDELPFGQSAVAHLRWFRQRARDAVAGGGDWRSVVDGVRPYTWRLWRELPIEDKKRFLRHARPWWDVHRHRMAPEVAAEIRRLLLSDQLRVMAGKLLRIESDDGAVLARFRRRHAKTEEALRVSRIVRCKGVYTDPRDTRNALLRNLFAQGRVRVHSLGIGLDVTESCQLIDGEGHPSDRLYAIGPLTRAVMWEIIAVPDIRLQCADLATRLSERPLNSTE